MKKSMLLFCMTFIIACNTPSKQPEDRKPVSKNMLSYKGNVKTVTELTYRYPEQDSKVSNDTSIYY